MGLLNRLIPPAKPERFARLMTKAIRDAGCAEPITFDAEQFRLDLNDTKRVLFLANAYNDYREVPLLQRAKVIAAYARTLTMEANPELPSRFDDVKAGLLPRVRPRWFHDDLALRRQLGEIELTTSFLHRPLADHLAIEVVYDRPDSVMSMGANYFEGWGVTLDEALAIARDNLWAISNKDFLQIQPGLWLAPYQDTHDASRLVLHDLVWQLPVKGEHLAMIPQRNVLLVTGSKDEAVHGQDGGDRAGRDERKPTVDGGHVQTARNHMGAVSAGTRSPGVREAQDAVP